MTDTMFCPNPFTWLDIVIRWSDYGALQFAICSPCWAMHSEVNLTPDLVKLKDLDTLDWKALWNAPRVQEIRQQWLDGIVPLMCQGCPRLKAGSDPPLPVDKITDPYLLDIIANRRTKTTPRVVNLSYDPSCNLCCPSCRVDPVRFRPGSVVYSQLKSFQDRIIRPILRGCERAFFSGYGDPFGSDLYQELLYTLTPEECPDLKLSLLTNGLGFTPTAYDRIPLRDRIEVVQFSIDAATGDTYRKLRGGSWTKLLANLEFVCRLRQQGRIDRFEAGFVYQATNWRELPAFVELCRDFWVDKIMVYTLLNHAHGDTYGQHAVHHATHPEHEAAMAMLREVRENARRAGGVEVYVEGVGDSSHG